MRRKIAAIAAVVVLAAAGCGDSSDDQDPPPRDQDSGEGVEEDPEQHSALSLKAVDFAFEPAEISVEPGDHVSIEVVNAGDVAHSFTAESVDVDVTAEVGETVLAEFAAPAEDATVDFVCRFHPGQMTGTIAVGAGGTGAGSGDEGEGSEDYDY